MRTKRRRTFEQQETDVMFDSKENTQEVPSGNEATAAVPSQKITEEQIDSARKVLNRVGMRYMCLEGKTVIGLWRDSDGPEVRAALHTTGLDRLPNRYLDEVGIPIRYKVRLMDVEPITSVPEEMDVSELEQLDGGKMAFTTKEHSSIRINAAEKATVERLINDLEEARAATQTAEDAQQRVAEQYERFCAELLECHGCEGSWRLNGLSQSDGDGFLIGVEPDWPF
jgi:hypothetical protein